MPLKRAAGLVSFRTVPLRSSHTSVRSVPQSPVRYTRTPVADTENADRPVSLVGSDVFGQLLGSAGEFDTFGIELLCQELGLTYEQQPTPAAYTAPESAGRIRFRHGAIERAQPESSHPVQD